MIDDDAPAVAPPPDMPLGDLVRLALDSAAEAIAVANARCEAAEARAERLREALADANEHLTEAGNWITMNGNLANPLVPAKARTFFRYANDAHDALAAEPPPQRKAPGQPRD